MSGCHYRGAAIPNTILTERSPDPDVDAPPW
jgi:hypothetical protein